MPPADAGNSWPDGERRDEPGPHRVGGLGRGGLDVLRVVVAAVDDHQVLDAAGDEQFPVEVDAHVAGAEPGGLRRHTLGVAAVLEAHLQLVLEGQFGFAPRPQ